MLVSSSSFCIFLCFPHQYWNLTIRTGEGQTSISLTLITRAVRVLLWAATVQHWPNSSTALMLFLLLTLLFFLTLLSIFWYALFYIIFFFPTYIVFISFLYPSLSLIQFLAFKTHCPFYFSFLFKFSPLMKAPLVFLWAVWKEIPANFVSVQTETFSKETIFTATQNMLLLTLQLHSRS